MLVCIDRDEHSVFLWEKTVREKNSIDTKWARWQGEAPTFAKPLIVQLEAYGMPQPFGEYYTITRDIKILNYEMLGDVLLSEIQPLLNQWNDAGTIGDHVLFGVPPKLYEIRERSRWSHPTDR